MRTLASLFAIILGSLVSSTAFAQGSTASGLKHRYSFGNTAGALANGAQVTDSIGGANGTVRGTGANATGSGVRLAGGSSSTSAYIDFPNGIASGSGELFPGLEVVTYELWVTVHSNKTWSRIIDFGNNSIDEVTGPGGTFNGADYLCVSANVGNANDILFERGGEHLTGGGNQFITGASTLGTPMHIVVTYDTASFQWKLYKNGAQIGTIPTLLGPSTIDDLNVWLGRSNWAADSNTDATFDEFRIYDRALSAQEVSASYAAGPDSLATDPPAAPTDLVASPGNGLVILSWTAPTSATGYNVKRATASGGPYTTVGNPTAANYNDTPLTNGTTYYFVVSALNGIGEGPDSAEVSATPLSPIQSWRLNTFGTTANSGLTADFADFDSDGLWNVWEYFLGTDATTSTQSPIQVLTITNRLAAVFPRNTAATDVTATVQGADSPGGPWTDLAQSVGGAPFTALVAGVTVTETGTGAIVSVEVKDLYQVDDPAHRKRFLKLNVQP